MAWSPSGNSFHTPEPDTAPYCHRCPSLLTYRVSLQLACLSLGMLAMIHISLKDLGHAESSVSNPYLHISRDTAPCLDHPTPHPLQIPIALGSVLCIPV